jgi:hypothetical protein
MSAGGAQGVDTRTLTILAFSATAGTLVELYDFFIYGYAAASAFPAIFFPRLPPTQGLVFSFLAFGAGSTKDQGRFRNAQIKASDLSVADTGRTRP